MDGGFLFLSPCDLRLIFEKMFLPTEFTSTPCWWIHTGELITNTKISVNIWQILICFPGILLGSGDTVWRKNQKQKISWYGLIKGVAATAERTLVQNNCDINIKYIVFFYLIKAKTTFLCSCHRPRGSYFIPLISNAFTSRTSLARVMSASLIGKNII